VIGNSSVEHYREHGYAVVEKFLTEAELAAAHREIDVMIPGWLDYAANPVGPRPTNWNEPVRSRRTMRFPFAGEALNAITLHPELIGFASKMCGGGEVVCEQADLTYKCMGHYGDVDQTMHVDYPNHTLAYPPNEPAYWQTAFLLYYTDVEAHQAPTAVTSWQRYKSEVLWPPFHKREAWPELYDNEHKVTVPAGSLLIYSMRTFHRGTAFLSEGARIGQFVSYSPRQPRWLGIVGWPEQGVSRSFAQWMAQASPHQREVIGFPKPDDPYWNEETVEGVAARFPKMDMRPYRG
jgi:hypothetical protein